jgi:hypothetical protein
VRRRVTAAHDARPLVGGDIEMRFGRVLAPRSLIAR